jgi:hypothetical protein
VEFVGLIQNDWTYTQKGLANRRLSSTDQLCDSQSCLNLIFDS